MTYHIGIVVNQSFAEETVARRTYLGNDLLTIYKDSVRTLSWYSFIENFKFKFKLKIYIWSQQKKPFFDFRLC